jgi:hypothetical protein
MGQQGLPRFSRSFRAADPYLESTETIGRLNMSPKKGRRRRIALVAAAVVVTFVAGVLVMRPALADGNLAIDKFFGRAIIDVKGGFGNLEFDGLVSDEETDEITTRATIIGMADLDTVAYTFTESSSEGLTPKFIHEFSQAPIVSVKLKLCAVNVNTGEEDCFFAPEYYVE